MMTHRTQYPASFTEFINCATSTTWDHSFPAMIGVLIHEVEESLATGSVYLI